MQNRRAFLAEAGLVSAGAAFAVLDGAAPASAQGVAGSNLVGRLEGAAVAGHARPAAALKEAP